MRAEEGPWILVVGGSHAEIPLIDAAHRLGYKVATTGNRPGDLGHPHGDRYVGADFSDPEQVRSAALSVGAVGIVAGCNDFAAISAAQVAEDLGLPGHDVLGTSLRLHHKDRFRALLDELGLPSPIAAPVHDVGEARELVERIGCPVIVKPVDLTGGKGMGVCHHPAELDAAVEHAFSLSRQDVVVVEQFLVGTNHGFTCFVEDGRITVWFADDEQYYRNPYLVSGTTTPTSMPPRAIDRMIASIESIARSLQVVDGLMHTQCIVTEEDAYIIELCRRCPGDLYPRFVELSTGYDYATAVVASELGRRIPAGTIRTPAPIGRHCLMTDREGTLEDITYGPVVSELLVDEMTWWSPGLAVTDPLVQKFGILFLRYRDRAQMVDLTGRLADLIETRVSS